MILVVGSTGLVGNDVCHRLAAAGIPARALVRSSSDPAKVAELQRLGFETVLGDLRDPASLADACRGVSAVICTVSSMPFSYQPGVNDIETTDRRGVIALIDAARAAGVPRFIYTSFSGNLDLPFPLRDAKRAVERHLAESGMDWTVLRPSCFMEVWLGPAVGFDASAATATIYGEGTKPISWIALTDVAAFAIASLDSPIAHRATLELGGPEALAPLEVVRRFERIGARPFTVQHVSEEALAAQQAAATDPMQQSFAGLMRCYALGDPIDMAAILSDIPIPLTTVDAYAAGVLAVARQPEPVGA